MADRMQQYADWLIANQNRKGTPEFNTVANAYKALRQQPQAAPDTSFSSAFKSSIDAPLENIALTADMLGYKGTADTLSNLTEAPANYESASNRFINPQEGDATIGGFAYEYLPRAAVEQAGNFAGSMISRTAGGLAGGAVTGGNPIGVAVGAFTAPAMFEFVQQLGGNAQERARNNGRTEPNDDDWRKAAAAAGMSGVLNAFGVGGNAKVFNRIAREGITETGQSGVQQTGVSLGTEAGLKLDTKQAVGEGIIGGTTAGGMSLPGSATSAAINLVSGGDTKVGDQQAASDVANDIQRIADAAGHDLMDVDPSSAGGAKQAVMDVHAEYAETMKALAADIKQRLGYEDSDTEAQRLDKILAKTALRKGRNVAKNIVNKDDFAAVQRLAGDTAEGQQLINYLKRSNELTRVNDGGYKGGLSRITDVFNPFDMNQGYSPARNTVSAMSGLLSGGAAISTQGISLIPQAATVGAGRLIDKATGRRSRVARYIKQNAEKQGLAAPDSPSLRLAREAEKNRLEATQSTADVISKARAAVQASQAKALNRQLDVTNAPPTPNSPQYVMEDATGLDKSGVNLMLAKLEQMENINPALKKAIDEYRTSVREGGIIENDMLSPLIRAVNAAVDSAPENQALMVRERNALSQPQVQGALTSIAQTKIETGKRDNQAFVEQLRARMEADETVPDRDKVMINRALDLFAQDLGSDPVAMAERILDEAYSKVNRAPAVTDYVLPYVNRVRQQQSGKKFEAGKAEFSVFDQPRIVKSPPQEIERLNGILNQEQTLDERANELREILGNMFEPQSDTGLPKESRFKMMDAIIEEGLKEVTDPEGRKIASVMAAGKSVDGLTNQEVKRVLPFLVSGFEFILGGENAPYYGAYRYQDKDDGVVYNDFIELVEMGEQVGSDTMTADNFLNTFFHEMGHAIEKKSRLREFLLGLTREAAIPPEYREESGTKKVLDEEGVDREALGEAIALSKTRRFKNWANLSDRFDVVRSYAVNLDPKMTPTLNKLYDAYLDGNYVDYMSLYKARDEIMDAREGMGIATNEEALIKDFYRLNDSIKYLYGAAELGADSVAYYMQHPKIMKRDFPKLAKLVRDAVNDSDVRKYITFHSLAGMMGAGALASILLNFGLGEDEEDKGVLSLGRGALSAA